MFGKDTITNIIAVAAFLLFAVCVVPTGSVARADGLHLTDYSPSGYTSSCAPTQFFFNYQGNPSNRHDMYRLASGIWAEEFPDGTVATFHTVTRDVVDGNAGTVIHKDNNDLYLFIPDCNANGSWSTLMRQRTAESDWHPFQYMVGVASNITSSWDGTNDATHLSFNYMGDPYQRHDMYRLEHGTWLEVCQDGTVFTFHATGRDFVDGNAGTVIHKDGTNFDLFVPDTSAVGQWPTLIRQRTAGGGWGTFQYIQTSNLHRNGG